MSLSVALVRDHLQQRVRLGGGVEGEVCLPRQVGLSSVNVGLGLPRDVGELLVDVGRLDRVEGLLRAAPVPQRRLRDAEVEVEVVVRRHVLLDGVEVDLHVLELLEEEEAHGHTLAARDGVAVTGRRADDLEALLRLLLELAVVVFLPHRRQHHPLDDVVLRGVGLEVLDELERLVVLAAVHVVDAEVDERLGHHVDERREHLGGAVAAAEHAQVVLQHGVLALRDGHARRRRQHLQLQCM
mmetsp:Transcript_18984/g.52255  ORF Transcript_18984/g.52255 Transcript_18984/m.52255 type:complete len:241 (-) Transcript_18984:194-916(-)